MRLPLLIALLLVSSTAADDPQFVSLFDGKTLAGWKALPPDTATDWSVRDGFIVGTGSKQRSYLVLDRPDLSDFELTFEYRLPRKGNTGVNIRGQVDETGKRGFKAYHADLGQKGSGANVLGAWDFHTPGRTEHACPRGRSLTIARDDTATSEAIDGAVTLDDIRANDWNACHVIAAGNRFRFLINGKPASEFVEHLPRGRRLLSGMIMLQLHDPGMEVHFRNLKLKAAPVGPLSRHFGPLDAYRKFLSSADTE